MPERYEVSALLERGRRLRSIRAYLDRLQGQLELPHLAQDWEATLLDLPQLAALAQHDGPRKCPTIFCGGSRATNQIESRLQLARSLDDLFE
jgi:hypothetical protein